MTSRCNFPLVHDHGARRRRNGFLLSKDFITYTTIGSRGQVWVSFVEWDLFILKYTTMGRGDAGVGFIC